MSKWVLVFDEKPESCEKCPMFKHGFCQKKHKWIIGNNKKWPDWCPMKKTPEHLTFEDMKECFWLDQTYVYTWNQVLDLIEEDENAD